VIIECLEVVRNDLEVVTVVSGTTALNAALLP